MSWKIFRSHHAEWLELQIENLTTRFLGQIHEQHLIHEREIDVLTKTHRDHVAGIEALNLDASVTAMRTIADLKKAHGEELSRAIQEIAKLRDDLDRTRLALTPALQSVSLRPDDSAPPSPSEIPTGTPWQRILARELARQEQETAKPNVKPAESPDAGVPEGGNTTH